MIGLLSLGSSLLSNVGGGLPSGAGGAPGGGMGGGLSISTPATSSATTTQTFTTGPMGTGKSDTTTILLVLGLVVMAALALRR